MNTSRKPKRRNALMQLFGNDPHDLGLEANNFTTVAEGEQGEIKQRKSASSDKRIFVAFPQNTNDAGEVISHLRAGSPCILNVEHLDYAAGKTIQDHIYGAIFYANGGIEQIGDKIFLFMPPAFESETMGNFDELKKSKGKNRNNFSRNASAGEKDADKKQHQNG